jgi:hypothetical protein
MTSLECKGGGSAIVRGGEKVSDRAHGCLLNKNPFRGLVGFAGTTANAAARTPRRP